LAMGSALGFLPSARGVPPDYYGAFVIDPDGHNVEAAIHTV